MPAGNPENYILCGIHIDSKKYFIKITIQLIVNKFFINFRKVWQYADRSVISFVTFFFLLCTSIISACLKACRNSPISIQKLKCKQTKLVKISAFILIILVGISFNLANVLHFHAFKIFLVSISLACVREKTGANFFALIFLTLDDPETYWSLPGQDQLVTFEIFWDKVEIWSSEIILEK